MLRTRTFAATTVAASLLALAIVAGAPPAAAQGATGKPVDIYRLGNPATTFAPYPADSPGALYDLVNRYREDIEVLFAKTGWDGDPQDFFSALHAGADGTGTVSRRQVTKGESFRWMAFRRGGEPNYISNPRWAADEPYGAWVVSVESKGYFHTFVIPDTCLNVAYVGKEALSCTVDASVDGCGADATVAIAVDGDFESSSLTQPAGATSTGPNRWSYTPGGAGSVAISAAAKRGIHTATCSATAEVEKCPPPPPGPTCKLALAPYCDTKTVGISATGEYESIEITSLDGPEGALDPSLATSTGGGSWTVPYSGDGIYGATATATRNDQTVTCSAAPVEVDCPRDSRWIVRGYGARLDGSADDQMTNIDAQTRTKTGVGNGSGFGAEVEYLPTERFGIFLGLLTGAFDSTTIFDVGSDWVSVDEDLDFTSIDLGVHFHLTPDRRVDFFLGPYLSRVQFDGQSAQGLGLAIRRDYDDETAFGLKLGLDVPFGDGGWGFTTGLRYLSLSAEDDRVSTDFGLDPLIFTAGLGYSF